MKDLKLRDLFEIKEELESDGLTEVEFTLNSEALNAKITLFELESRLGVRFKHGIIYGLDHLLSVDNAKTILLDIYTQEKANTRKELEAYVSSKR